MQIHDLTQEQHDTLVEMWNIDNMDDLIVWKNKQPKSKRIQISTLIELVKLAHIDEAVEADYNLDLANELLETVGI